MASHREEAFEAAMVTAKAEMLQAWNDGLKTADNQAVFEKIGDIAWGGVEDHGVTDYYDAACEQLHTYLNELGWPVPVEADADWPLPGAR